MRAVVQRVYKASVSVEGKVVSSIGNGQVCYLGIGRGDSFSALQWLAKKVAKLRIFPDDQGKMNLSAIDCDYEILVISQFTLYGDIRNGYRPGFSAAEAPDIASKMYDQFRAELESLGVKKVYGGVFGTDMTIEQSNAGPVTIILSTDQAA